MTRLTIYLDPEAHDQEKASTAPVTRKVTGRMTAEAKDAARLNSLLK